MKKIIIILWAMLISFCAYGQENERLRNHKMPEKIEDLFQYAESLGYPKREEYYNTNEIFIKKSWISPSFFNNEKRTLMLDSIRNTFMELNNDESKECYMYETHHDSIDSMSYRLMLDTGQKKKVVAQNPITKKTYYRTLNFDRRSLVFRHTPERWGSFAYMAYEYRDSVVDRPREPINKKEYWEIVKKVLKQHGVKGQPYYVYNDSCLNDHTPDVGDGNLLKHCRIIEQKGYVYEMETKEQLEKIMQDLLQETWNYLDQHPNVRYYIYPRTINPDLNRDFISLYADFGKDISNYFYVQVIHYHQHTQYHQPDHFWLIAREIKGDDFLPRDWETLKSYKNGKKVYHKK